MPSYEGSTGGNSPAPWKNFLFRSFLRMSSDQFRQMPFFQTKKIMSILNQPVFVASTPIHPRDQQARLVGFKAMHCAQAHHGVTTLHFGGLLKKVWETDTESIRSILDRILILNFSVVTNVAIRFLPEKHEMQRIYHLFSDHRQFKNASIILAIVLGTMGHHQYTWCHPKLILVLSSREVAVNQCPA